jgi:transposase InsO family protein
MSTRHAGWAPGERTLQRHFARLGLNARPDGTGPAAFGRFEAAARNELWTGDALHGPKIDGRYLFASIDDHSRALVGYRWGHSEDTVRLEAALRAAPAARGVPQRIYVDNGSAFVDSQLLRTCTSLGIQLVHSRPGQPAGRGKIERVSRTVREQFLVSCAGNSIKICGEPLKDLVGGLGPDEGLRVLVPLFDPGPDVAFEGLKVLVDPAPQLSLCQPDVGAGQRVYGVA